MTIVGWITTNESSTCLNKPQVIINQWLKWFRNWPINHRLKWSHDRSTNWLTNVRQHDKSTRERKTLLQVKSTVCLESWQRNSVWAQWMCHDIVLISCHPPTLNFHHHLPCLVPPWVLVIPWISGVRATYESSAKQFNLLWYRGQPACLHPSRYTCIFLLPCHCSCPLL